MLAKGLKTYAKAHNRKHGRMPSQEKKRTKNFPEAEITLKI